MDMSENMFPITIQNHINDHQHRFSWFITKKAPGRPRCNKSLPRGLVEIARNPINQPSPNFLHHPRVSHLHPVYTRAPAHTQFSLHTLCILFSTFSNSIPGSFTPPSLSLSLSLQGLCSARTRILLHTCALARSRYITHIARFSSVPIRLYI